ncbi:MAG: toll/interleukin-1 receptor domain-containing protein [Alphaproteobacteria bacterium]|nr:toll/interleukin-1 receptor domain-containing protein [Clostridia bacterium]MBQ7674677.1 toll/interleukin-1 receptor domain-containing protein [Alphaproteobacteria bacterium]
MNRIFLSHSSKDKEYVEYIANKFGKDIAYYDKYSFEGGMPTISEILNTLSNTDLFVLFLSDTALNSQWVQREIKFAFEGIQNEKIKQFYPIIIDHSINYTDDRIPEWLKNGIGAYNLRFIGSPQLAYRKIKNLFAQLNETQPNNDYRLYIGHENLLKEFDTHYYTQKAYQGIIAYGIEGIGREAFIRQCIKVPRTFGDYYDPIVISLEKNDSIDDVISKLIDNGFGEYNKDYLAEINALSLDDKIKRLESCFKLVQNSKEFIIFRDDDVLIQSGDVVWWLLKSIESIREELTLGIVANQRVRNNKRTGAFFIKEIPELDNPNKLKLLDKLSKESGLSLGIDDIRFFQNILTGHPLQIHFCIEKILADSLQDVKRKSHEIVEFVAQSTIRILDKYLGLMNFTDDRKNKFLSYLSFLSSYSNIPISEIVEINKLDEDYKDFYNMLLRFCICRRTGINNDLLTVSSTVIDYIERNRISIPSDIVKYLQLEFRKFKDCLKVNELDDYCYSQISKNLGELVKENTWLNDCQLIYPSIILKSIIQLYNKKVYDRVKDICQKCLDAVEVWELTLKQTFYFYYAMCLVREKDGSVFEILQLKYKNEYILKKFQADFIKGFYYKLVGKYDTAEECFISCLNENSSYFRASRELVETYIALEEYDAALELAEKNYNRFQDNIFNIFQYFKCAIRQKVIKLDVVEELLNKAKEVDRLPITSKQFYPNMKAYYSFYVKHDYHNALRIMIENKLLFENQIYYYRDLFDIYAELKDITKMRESYVTLKELIDKDNSFMPLLLRRECILNYFENGDINRVNQIVNMARIDPMAKDRIKRSLYGFIEKH